MQGQISSNMSLCAEDEWRSYRSGMTWGWVINGRIFGWTLTVYMQEYNGNIFASYICTGTFVIASRQLSTEDVYAIKL